MKCLSARSPIRVGAPVGRLGMLLLACVLITALTACQVGNAPPATLHAAISSSGGATNEPGALSLVRVSPTPFDTTLPFDPEVRSWLDHVASDRLMIAIDTLAAMHTRHVLSAGFDPMHGVGISAARDYLIAQFQAIRSPVPLTVWTQPILLTLNGVSASSDNIVAVTQGSDPNAGVIVIGAHYDSVNADDFNSPDLPAPGANENGSGVAALLELARLLTSFGQPRATLIFAAFTAEETGRQGSLAFVKAYLQAQQPPIVPKAMLNLDTIGSNQTPDGQPGPDTLRVFSADPDNSPSRQLARQIQLLASAYPSLPQLIVQSSNERVGHFGDQQSFSDDGIAAVRFVEGVEDPSRQRSTRDTPDAIQLAYLMGATRAMLAALVALADGPDAPQQVTWHANTGTLTWRPVKQAAGYVIAARHGESASFDWAVTVGASPEFIWSGLTAYAFAAVAAFDAQGRIGALSPEIPLT